MRGDSPNASRRGRAWTGIQNGTLGMDRRPPAAYDGFSVGEQLSAALESDILFDLSPAKVPQVQDQAKIVAELGKRTGPHGRGRNGIAGL